MQFKHSRVLEYLISRTRLELFFRNEYGNDIRNALAKLYTDKNSWNDVVVRGFDDLKQSSADAHVPVVVVVFPFILDFNAPWMVNIHKKVTDESLRHGFTTLDLLPAFSKYKPEQLKTEGEISHPNKLGHRIAAEQTYIKMKSIWGCKNN